MLVKEREKECKKLVGYLKSFIDGGKGSVVYISGVPGSGKTYTTQKVLGTLLPDHAYINCAKIGPKSHIYRAIYDAIGCAKKRAGPYLQSIHEHIRGCDTLHCILVDEIDLLLNKKQDILYNIFDLPYTESSQVMIVAVANTMNLPEKFFDPKVCSRIGNNRIDFAPYTHTQLVLMVKKDKRFQGGSVELVAKRIGAVSGDARRLFDVIKRVKESSKDEITIYDVDETMKNMYRPLYCDFLQNLSFCQKLAVFILSAGERIKSVDAHARMKAYCVLRDLRPLDLLAFLEILRTLDTHQIVELTKGNTEVQLVLVSQEVKNALCSDKDYCSFGTYGASTTSTQ